MKVTATKCGGGGGGSWPCVTLNGNTTTPSDIGKVIDAGSYNANTGQPIYYKITSIDPSTQAPSGTADFPIIPGGCPTNNNTNTCDFSWGSTCAQQHLNTGGQSSWQNMLTQRESGYNANGCQHFQAMVNWVTNQLNSGVAANGNPLSQVQINRKNEQIDWAECQASTCGCPSLNIPPQTGGPTPPPPSAPPSAPPSGNRSDSLDDEREVEELREEINRIKKLINK